MESAIFWQAIKDYFRPRRFLPWMLLGGLCLAIAMLWSSMQEGASAKDSYLQVSSIFVFHILPLASAIFTTAIVSQEVEQKTIVYLLTRPVPRWKLLVLRYLASVIVVSTIGVVCAVLATIGAYHGFGSNPYLLTDCAAMVVGAFAYGAFFLLLSLMFNRAMIICLLFAFGWETAIPNMPGQMYLMSIVGYLHGIAQHPSEGQNKLLGFLSSSNGDNTLSSGTAYASMVALVLVMLGLGAWWFTNFEYLPREDAE